MVEVLLSVLLSIFVCETGTERERQIVTEPRFQFRFGKIKREKIESKIILKNSNSILITNK